MAHLFRPISAKPTPSYLSNYSQFSLPACPWSQPVLVLGFEAGATPTWLLSCPGVQAHHHAWTESIKVAFSSHHYCFLTCSCLFFLTKKCHTHQTKITSYSKLLAKVSCRVSCSLPMQAGSPGQHMVCSFSSHLQAAPTQTAFQITAWISKLLQSITQ